MFFRVLILSAFLICQLVGLAQHNSIAKLWSDEIELADQLFEEGLFSAAASRYLEIAFERDTFPKKNNESDAELALKIGDCFYKLRRMKEASNYFSLILQRESKSPSQEHLLRYAETLLYQEQIEEAKYWFNQYYMQSKDPLGKDRFRGTIIYDELMASIKPTVIKSVIYNDKTSFISPKKLNDKIYFSAQKETNPWVDQEYLQGGQELYQLFFLDSLGFQQVKTTGKLSNASSPELYGKDSILVTASNEKDQRLKLFEGIQINDRKWGNFKESILNDSIGSIHSISFYSDTLFFSSNKPGGMGGFDLYYAVITDSGWAEPVNMGPFINTSGNELYPFKDSLRFCFSSDGHPGLGGYDVFSVKDEEVINLASPLNTSQDDLGIIFTSRFDGYLFSNRKGGEGKDDLYQFTQTDNPEVLFEINLTRKVNGAMMPDAAINLSSTKGDHVLELTTDEIGQARAQLRTRTDYQLKVSLPGYIELIDTLEVGLESIQTSYEIDEQYSFQSLVFSGQTNAAIVDPTVFVEDLDSKKRSEIVGNSTGFFEIRKPSNSRVSILITKEGYDFAVDTIDFSEKEITKTYTLDKVKPAGSLTLKNLLYELDQHKLQGDYVPVLDSIARSLNRFENLRIIVESHTDSRGEKEYNLRLSQLRAESVKDYLISKGISAARIGAVGKGEEELLNECEDGVSCSDEQHRVNRRTEVKLFQSN